MLLSLSNENSSGPKRHSHTQKLQSSEAVTAGKNAAEQINQPQRSDRLLIWPTARSHRGLKWDMQTYYTLDNHGWDECFNV